MTNESKDDICVRCGETTSAGLVTRQGNHICKTCNTQMEKQIKDVIKQDARSEVLKEAKAILLAQYNLAVEANRVSLNTDSDKEYFLGASHVLKEVLNQIEEL